MCQKSDFGQSLYTRLEALDDWHDYGFTDRKMGENYKIWYMYYDPNKYHMDLKSKSAKEWDFRLSQQQA